MKQKILLLLLFALSSKAFTQNSKISFEISYPIVVNEDFTEGNSKGIIDAGFKYRFGNSKNLLQFGIGINGGILIDNSNKNNLLDSSFSITTYVFQPKIFAEFNIKEKIHPFLGFGITSMSTKFSGSIFGMDVSDQATALGASINLNLGIAYNINHRFFIQIQYDTSPILSTLKIGAGYRI